MDKRIELYWVEKYPNLFPGYHKTVWDTPMARGFTCGNGWFYILDKLWKELNKIPALEIGQVKEKLGGLRVYRDPWATELIKKSLAFFDEKINTLIEDAVIKSLKTCEMCGAAGQRKNRNWTFTLCDNCHGKADLWSVSEQTGNKIVRELGLRTMCESEEDHIPDFHYKECVCCGAKMVRGEWEV